MHPKTLIDACLIALYLDPASYLKKHEIIDAFTEIRERAGVIRMIRGPHKSKDDS